MSSMCRLVCRPYDNIKRSFLGQSPQKQLGLLLGLPMSQKRLLRPESAEKSAFLCNIITKCSIQADAAAPALGIQLLCSTEQRLPQVVGVPARFDDGQCQATLQAARSAGLDSVHLLRGTFLSRPEMPSDRAFEPSQECLEALQLCIAVHGIDDMLHQGHEIH